MKKTKIMPVMTAALLASSCVLPALDDIRTVNAQVTEDAVTIVRSSVRVVPVTATKISEENVFRISANGTEGTIFF